MTKKQHMIQAKKMLKSLDINSFVMKRVQDYLFSGGIDYERYNKADFSPTRAMIAASLEEVAQQVIPKDSVGKSIFNNLRHF